MGLVVGLPTPGQDEWEGTVVGVCATVEREKPLAALKACGLASPDWEASKELVARHYPTGTEVAGVWLRREMDEDREEIMSVLQLLINTTGLNVSYPIHSE